MTRLLLVVLALPCALAAQVVLPGDYRGKPNALRVEALVVHADGHQEMAVRITPDLAGMAVPRRMVCVIPVAGARTGYSILDEAPFIEGGQLHDNLYRLARRQWAARTDFTLGAQAEAFESTTPKADPPPPGPAAITASQQKGAAAVTELNQWLQQAGYPALNESGWSGWGEELSFVWVQVTTATAATMPPVQVGFRTESALCPLKHLAAQGAIELSLTVISAGALDYERLVEIRERLGAQAHDHVQLHNLWTMQPLPAPIAPLAGGKAANRWFVNRITAAGFNAVVDGKPRMETWPDDVALGMGDLEDELPGFWYYADRDVSWPERMFREHALAMFIGGSLLILGVVVAKGRANRRRALRAAGHHELGRQG